MKLLQNRLEEIMDGQLISPPTILKLASHPIRWSLLIRLARSDYRVQDLVEYLKLPQNLVSYHLRQLRSGWLVTERKSSADERSVYYRLDLEQFHLFYMDAGEQLHPAITGARTAPDNEKIGSSTPSLRILFLCTENSARSQMAEALMRHLSHGTIAAYSAGNRPAQQVHPLAQRVMQRMGIDISQAIPRHCETFFREHFDAIVTVCDRVRELCPLFPNDPERIHWSFPDPAQVEGTEEVQYAAFEQTARQLTTRIRLLITLLQREKGYL